MHRFPGADGSDRSHDSCRACVGRNGGRLEGNSRGELVQDAIRLFPGDPVSLGRRTTTPVQLHGRDRGTNRSPGGERPLK